jgi:hypothetical protein
MRGALAMGDLPDRHRRGSDPAAKTVCEEAGEGVSAGRRVQGDDDEGEPADQNGGGVAGAQGETRASIVSGACVQLLSRAFVWYRHGGSGAPQMTLRLEAAPMAAI